MTRADDPAAFRIEFTGKVPPEIAAAMTRADPGLADSAIVEAAIKAGQTAPAVNLPEPRGGQVWLADLVAPGCGCGWRSNHALPDRNGTESWAVPIPATFVIARDGIVALDLVEADYRLRLEPADIINTLEPLI